MSKKVIKNLMLVMVMAVLFLAMAMTASAETTYYQDKYVYTVEDGNATIIEFYGSHLGVVNIPSTLGGFPVTSIGEKVFHSSRNTIEIHIPDSVNHIAENAFYECEMLYIYYDGKESEWNSIDIHYENFHLMNAEIHFSDSGETILSGKLGTFSKYCLYNDGTLYLTSCREGYYEDMNDYSTPESYPWHDYRDIIKKVVFKGCYEGIGKYAFYNCTALESVSFSPYMSNLNIYDYAFYNCSSLKSMFILGGRYVGTYIGHSAFAYCSSMTEISFPGVVYIADYSFMDCSNLKNVYLCGEVNYYDFEVKETSFTGVVADVVYPSAALKNDSMKNNNYGGTLTWKEANHGPCAPNASWSYDSEEKLLTISGSGNIFYRDSGVLMPWYGFSPEILSIEVGEGISRIESYVFEYCTNVETIELPDTLKYLCTNAVNDCHNLKNLMLPGSIEVFGYTSINSCYSMTDLYFKGTEEEWKAIKNSEEICNPNLPDMNIHFLVDCSVSPTCTQEGTETYYQFDKKDVYYYFYDSNKNIIDSPVSVPMLDHSYTNYIPNGDETCSSYGTKTAYCDYNCGNSNTIPGDKYKTHIYTSSVITPATHLKDGVLAYTCPACGDNYTKPIAKLECHTHKAVVITPTCTTLGYTTYTCECGDSYTTDYVVATGHCDNNTDGVCDGCGIELETDNDGDNCSCMCHKSGIMGFIWKILNFFYKMFGMNKTCACGIAHY